MPATSRARIKPCSPPCIARNYINSRSSIVIQLETDAALQYLSPSIFHTRVFNFNFFFLLYLSLSSLFTVIVIEAVCIETHSIHRDNRLDDGRRSRSPGNTLFIPARQSSF